MTYTDVRISMLLATKCASNERRVIRMFCVTMFRRWVKQIDFHCGNVPAGRETESRVWKLCFHPSLSPLSTLRRPLRKAKANLSSAWTSNDAGPCASRIIILRHPLQFPGRFADLPTNGGGTDRRLRELSDDSRKLSSDSVTPFNRED